jgi:formylglycine-generating enzyme required for sulfatase activity
MGPHGAHDMIGNVAEWCADVPDPAAYAKHEPGQVDPVSFLGEPAFRIVRGGSWLDQEGNLPVALRGRYWARQRRRFIGFRCALAQPAE